MTREQYKASFSRIIPDPALEARTERMAMEMLNRKTKRNLSVALIAAIVFILAAGLAVAASVHSGLLEGLFTDGEPTDAAQQAVIGSNQRVEDQGVSLTMKEYLMDGNSLHCAWQVESQRDEPIYYTTSYEIDDGGAMDEQPVGGHYGGYASGEVGDNMLVQLTPERNGYAGNLGNGYVQAPDQPIRVTLTLHVYTSELIPEVVDGLDSIYGSEGTDAEGYQAMAAAGKIGVTPEGYCWLNEYPAYEEALARHDLSKEDLDTASEAALSESGLMIPLTQLSLTVEIPVQTSDKANSAVYGAAEYILPDRRVMLRECSMDVASTVVRYDIYPHEDIDFSGDEIQGWWYLLVDPEGHVMNADIGLSMSAESNAETRLPDEPLCIRVTCSGNPVPNPPTALTFVPTCALERQENESSDAYYQRMVELANPADCFSISLENGE